MTAAELGQALRRARQAKGLSLRALGQACDMEYSYIAYLEQGKFDNPDPKKLQRLAQALDVAIEDFYALAGYLPASGLPELQPYLRAKYDLPEDAAQQIDAYVKTIQAKYTTNEHEQGSDHGHTARADGAA
jgi:transcriptional regulator with XRE-family HTH domain